MNFSRSSIPGWAAIGAVAVGAVFTATSANAETSWSIGIGLPGVSLGIAEPAPVYYPPAPVYVAPPPVYYHRPPPVYYQPPPVYYRPAPRGYYGPPGHYRHGWRHRHHRDWDDRDDRGDRDD